jgi:hypothetical protein
MRRLGAMTLLFGLGGLLLPFLLIGVGTAYTFEGAPGFVSRCYGWLHPWLWPTFAVNYDWYRYADAGIAHGAARRAAFWASVLANGMVYAGVGVVVAMAQWLFGKAGWHPFRRIPRRAVAGLSLGMAGLLLPFCVIGFSVLADQGWAGDLRVGYRFVERVVWPLSFLLPSDLMLLREAQSPWAGALLARYNGELRRLLAIAVLGNALLYPAAGLLLVRRSAAGGG